MPEYHVQSMKLMIVWFKLQELRAYQADVATVLRNGMIYFLTSIEADFDLEFMNMHLGVFATKVFIRLGNLSLKVSMSFVHDLVNVFSCYP